MQLIILPQSKRMSFVLSAVMLFAVISMIYYWRRREYMCLPAPPFYVPWIGHLSLLFDNEGNMFDTRFLFLSFLILLKILNGEWRYLQKLPLILKNGYLCKIKSCVLNRRGFIIEKQSFIFVLSIHVGITMTTTQILQNI